MPKTTTTTTTIVLLPFYTSQPALAGTAETANIPNYFNTLFVINAKNTTTTTILWPFYTGQSALAGTSS